MKNKRINVLQQNKNVLAGIHSYCTKHRQMEVNP